MKLKIRQETINWFTSPSETKVTHFVINERTKKKAFGSYFREYENRYKYCNNVRFFIANNRLAEEYRAWISDIQNYANYGGDTW